MAYDQTLEQRIKQSFQLFPEPVRADMELKKMFGGLAYLYRGKMTVGILKNDLCVRIVPEKMATMLSQDYVRPMEFTGRPMKEFVFVSPDGFRSEEELQQWIELGMEHARRKLNIE